MKRCLCRTFLSQGIIYPLIPERVRLLRISGYIQIKSFLNYR